MRCVVCDRPTDNHKEWCSKPTLAESFKLQKQASDTTKEVLQTFDFHNSHYTKHLKALIKKKMMTERNTDIIPSDLLVKDDKKQKTLTEYGFVW